MYNVQGDDVTQEAGQSDGLVFFTVPEDAPDRFVYKCSQDDELTGDLIIVEAVYTLEGVDENDENFLISDDGNLNEEPGPLLYAKPGDVIAILLKDTTGKPVYLHQRAQTPTLKLSTVNLHGKERTMALWCEVPSESYLPEMFYQTQDNDRIGGRIVDCVDGDFHVTDGSPTSYTIPQR